MSFREDATAAFVKMMNSGGLDDIVIYDLIEQYKLWIVTGKQHSSRRL